MAPLQLAAALLLAHGSYAFPNVALTVSSLKIPREGEGPHVIQRQMEIVWMPMPDAEWLGLFNVEPPQKASLEPAPLVRINPSEHPGGFYRTNVSLPRQEYPNGWSMRSQEEPVPGDVCMSFWVAAYNKNNQLLESDCIKIRPTWMGDHRAKLQILTLANLFIPGTHNSATFNRATMEHTGESIGHCMLTQDTDVWGQLVHGIRYLDLHIRHYPGSRDNDYKPATKEEERYRKLVNVEAVTNILEEIKEFLRKASSEIVILDINDFPPGFEVHTSNHQQFVSLLNSILGEFVLPSSNVSYNSTLADVWKSGKNLIVAYNDPGVTKKYDWLWDQIPRVWTVKQPNEELKQFLQERIDDVKTDNRRTTFWAIMAAFKPTPIDFMFGGTDSLRELADMHNRELARWFVSEEWWKYTNIVATDFFLGNNIIDAAVKASVDKANNLAQATLEEEMVTSNRV